MSWLDRLLNRQPRRAASTFSVAREAYPYPDGPNDEPAPSGATGGTYGYTHVGAVRRDLDPMTLQDAIERSYRQWQTHPLAFRFLENQRNYVTLGVRPASQHEKVAKLLDDMWTHPEMKWWSRLSERSRELAIFGEYLQQVFVNVASGLVKFASIDPTRICRVVTDPENSEIVREVWIKPVHEMYVPGENEIKLLHMQYSDYMQRFYGLDDFSRRVIAGEWPDGVESLEDLERLRKAVYYDGECLLFQVNKLTTGNRGRPDLTVSLDWLDKFDRVFFDVLEWIQLVRTFVFDVEVVGANEEELRRRQKEVGTPKPGSTIYHNELEKWNAVTPDLKAYDLAVVIRQLTYLLSAGAGVPAHWLGSGESTNLATAVEMADPALKNLSERQAFIADEWIWSMCSIVLSEAYVHGQVPLFVEIQGKRLHFLKAFKVERVDLNVRDIQRIAQAFMNTISAVAEGRTAQALDPDTTADIISAVVSQFGVEVSREKVLAELKKPPRPVVAPGGNGTAPRQPSDARARAPASQSGAEQNRS